MEVQQIQHGTEGRISNADVSSPYNQPDTTARHLKELKTNVHTTDHYSVHAERSIHGVCNRGNGRVKKIFTRPSSPRLELACPDP